jgi:hypothetical protein
VLSGRADLNTTASRIPLDHSEQNQSRKSERERYQPGGHHLFAGVFRRALSGPFVSRLRIDRHGIALARRERMFRESGATTPQRRCGSPGLGESQILFAHPLRIIPLDRRGLARRLSGAQHDAKTATFGRPAR